MAKRLVRKPTTSLAVQDDQELLVPGPKRDRLLDQSRSAGAKWVRANIEYSKTKGGTDLSAVDALVDAARKRGLHVQATLMSDPSYAAPGGKLTYQNNDPKLWAQFARTVAAREKGRIGRYSVGNEMNYPAFNAGYDQNPKQAGRVYRNVYREGRKAIRNVDRKAQVLFGELTNNKGTADFMKGALGGKRLYTDGFAYHPYVGDNTKEGGIGDANDPAAIQRVLRSYKSKLQTVKGRQAPLYLTEFGSHRENEPDDVKRAQTFAGAYERAKLAGARQLLQYQLTDKSAQAVERTPARLGGYGETLAPGGEKKKWVWDTSAGTASGDLSAFTNALRSPRTVRRRIVRRGV